MKSVSLSRTQATFLFAAVTIVAYLLPWLTSNGGAALTFNGTDLAEWASLHPSSAYGPVAFFPSALLRAVLVMVAVYLGFTIPPHHSVIAVPGILLVVLMAAPPAEFLRSPGNGNYQQMAGLAIMALAAGLIGHFLARGNVRQYCAIAALATGLLASVSGLLAAMGTLQSLQIPFYISAGALLTISAFAVTLALEASHMMQQKRSSISAAP